jgi:hypothetical protein
MRFGPAVFAAGAFVVGRDDASKCRMDCPSISRPAAGVSGRNPLGLPRSRRNLGEQHLRYLLNSYQAYYNESRTPIAEEGRADFRVTPTGVRSSCQCRIDARNSRRSATELLPAKLSGKGAIFDQVALLRRVARRQPKQSRRRAAQDVVFGSLGQERQIVNGAR